MPENSNIDTLPNDILNEFSLFLNLKDMCVSSCVSKRWYSMFTDTNIWKFRILKEFDIKPEVLAEFDDSKQFYKNLYIRLHHLRQNSSKLPQFVKYIYDDPTKQSLLLTCCMDNADFAFEKIPCEEHYNYMLVSLAARCLHIPLAYYERDIKGNCLREAIKLGHFEFLCEVLPPKNPKKIPVDSGLITAAMGKLKLMRYLLDPKNEFKLTLTQFDLGCNAKTGNLELICYLLDPENNFGVCANQDVLHSAARSGSVELVRYLINDCELHPDESTLKYALESGSIELVRYLLNPKNEFKLCVDKNTKVIGYACESGNCDLVKYLLTEEKVQFPTNPGDMAQILLNAASTGKVEFLQYLLNSSIDFRPPNLRTLVKVARAGHLNMVRYLLNPENNFKLKASTMIFEAAAHSGNLELVQYLITEFSLCPNYSTLMGAIFSGSIELVRFLLNPENKFGLHCDKKFNYACTNAGLEHLLPSDAEFQKALKQLQEGNYDAAKLSLQKSQKFCPNHFSLMRNHLLSNNKTNVDLQFLTNFFEGLEEEKHKSYFNADRR